jgi:hypothetical protein
MAFTPPTGPVIDDPLRPRALWYWIGGGLIAATTIGAVVWLVTGILGVDDKVDGFERVPAAEGGTITIDDPGDYVIYAEGPQTTFGVSDITVTDPDGDEVQTSLYGGSLTYDFGGRSGSAQETFTADEAGDYEIETDGLASGNAESLAVGDSIGGDLVSAIVGGFVIGGLGLVIGAIVLIVTGVRRSKAKKERQPPAPPSAWGQAPQTWGPQPASSQPAWNQPAPGQPPPAPGQVPPPPPGWPT